MNKSISKSAILMMMLFGLLFVAAATDANAQNRCRNRGGNYRGVSNNYYNNNYDNYNDDTRYRDSRRRGSRNYEDDQDTTGKALTRTGIGAGIGAGGGALIGGKKGAAIGAAIGAAGGYVYHRKKVSNQRDRYRY